MNRRVSRFIGQRCHAVAGLKVRLADLWDQFREESDFHPAHQTKADFVACLDELGYERGRGPSNQIYVINLDVRALRRPYQIRGGKLVLADAE
ncbi:MAG TPA: hypothetical protein VHC22_02250 [Pirellulales bacterium]|nr:hypothetical protein [Pirellulales bacterium]